MTTTPHSVSGALPMQVERLRAKIEAEARRYAAMYPEASDGRNTFVIFADYVAALAKPEGGTVTDDGVWKADAEVERILSLSDDQVLAEASPEDLAWARLFKARMIAIKHALPGRYDGTSTYAVVRGEADDAPYMLAIREALSASPKLTTGASSEEVERLNATLLKLAEFADNFFAPWGSWKTSWWEGEVSDDAAFTADNALKHVANVARRSASSPTPDQSNLSGGEG